MDKILDNGIELANIKFMYNPSCQSANVQLDVDHDLIGSEWYSPQASFMELAEDVEDLGTIVKKIMGFGA